MTNFLYFKDESSLNQISRTKNNISINFLQGKLENRTEMFLSPNFYVGLIVTPKNFKGIHHSIILAIKFIPNHPIFLMYQGRTPFST